MPSGGQLTPTPSFRARQELIAIQQSGPKAIGFFGTRNMGFLHQQMIEILSYAMVLTVSGSPCCIRSAKNAERASASAV